MRKALSLSLLFLLLTTPVLAREGRITGVRSQAVTRVPSGQRLETAREGRSVEEQTLPPIGSTMQLLGPVLSCGNDGVVDPSGTLVLEAGDAAGTIYAPVAEADSLDILRVLFGAIDFGATYPATMAVDFWHRSGADSWDFVVGIDVAVDTNPGIEGDTYDVDVSALGLRTNNEMMVLLADLNPTRDGLLLPAGDSSQTCFDGSSFCSVVLPNAASELFLYGIVSDQPAPDGCQGVGVNDIQLFDIVVEVEVMPVVVPTEEFSFGAIKARFGN